MFLHKRLIVVLLASLHFAANAEPISYNFTTIDGPNGGAADIYGINNAGDMVIRSGGNNYLYSGGVFTPIVVPGSVQTYVSAINNLGDIAGFAVFPDGRLVLRALVISGGVVTVLNTPGFVSPNVTGINNSGEIVGVYEGGGFGSASFVYLNGQVADFRYPSASGTYLGGINDLGQLAGQAQFPNGTSIGFVYEQGVFLPVQHPGSVNIFLTGINNSGDIIGNYGAGLSLPFAYVQGEFVPINGPQGSYDITPRGINDLGQIVGFYVDPSNGIRGFLATPVPEGTPSALLLCGFVVLAIVRSRRPRRPRH
jgi:hypothetical protein